MNNPRIRIEINPRWLHRFLESHFGRTVASYVVLEVRRETTHIIENLLVAGQSVSLGSAIGEALDMLGYMTDISVDVTAVS